jgi:RES domain-containing protein
MKVFRLVNSVFANLEPIGISGRWNKDKDYVIYASQSIALSCLEILALMERIPEKVNYSLVQYELADRQVFKPELKASWHEQEEYTRMIGTNWYNQRKTLALKVPSVIVNSEFNFVINARHQDYIKLFDNIIINPFVFDKRLFR